MMKFAREGLSMLRSDGLVNFEFGLHKCNTAVLCSGAARYVCQGNCEDFRPDCDGWCRTAGGYPKGGQCVPPLLQYCCCID